MGTFAPDPLGNDTALDFKDTLKMRESPRERGLMIRTQLALLSTYHPGARRLPDEIHDVYQATVGACAIVADKLLGEHRWMDPFDEDEDLTLADLPEIDAPTLELACSAIGIARALAANPAMPDWRSVENAQAHAKHLEDVQAVLNEHARKMPGCSAFQHGA